MSTEKNRRRRERQKVKRHERLEASNKNGWKKCSEYHFQKRIDGRLVNWWPSTNKIMIDNTVYQIIDGEDIQPIVDMVNGKEGEK